MTLEAVVAILREDLPDDFGYEWGSWNSNLNFYGLRRGDPFVMITAPLRVTKKSYIGPDKRVYQLHVARGTIQLWRPTGTGDTVDVLTHWEHDLNDPDVFRKVHDLFSRETVI